MTDHWMIRGVEYGNCSCNWGSESPTSALTRRSPPMCRGLLETTPLLAPDDQPDV